MGLSWGAGGNLVKTVSAGRWGLWDNVLLRVPGRYLEPKRLEASLTRVKG